MNSSCPIGAFDYGPNHIPLKIRKSKLLFQKTVLHKFFISCFNDNKQSLILTNSLGAIHKGYPIFLAHF